MSFTALDERSLFAALGAGARFSKRKHGAQMELFETGRESSEEPEALNSSSSAPISMDFFSSGSAATKPAQSSSRPAKKQRTEENTASQPENENEQIEGEPITEEQIAVFRKQNRIKVSGSEAPAPFASFAAFCKRYQLKQFLVDNLKLHGFDAPTPIQMQTMPVMVEHRDSLAIAPTGSGKTLAYILPIIHRLKAPSPDGYRALILVPTRELGQQIYREMKKLVQGRNFKLCVLTKATAGANKTNSQSFGKFDVLITTPMRLVHMIKEQSVDLSRVEQIVLDEGDKLFEMGFLEQIDEIFAACTHPQLTRHFFSATLPQAIEEMASSVMRDPIRITVGARNTTAETIKQRLMYVGTEEGKLLAVRQLIQQGVRPPVLIFVQSKERAKELFHELIYDGINVDVIHSERTAQQRDTIVDNFRTGRIWFLIASELMSRGMDFKGVNLVINYDFPQSIVSYIHRIGRAGRAGRPGEAVTFFTNDDAEYLRMIANVMKESGCDIPEWMLSLPKPRKDKRKKLEKRPPQRKHISTVPSFDKRMIGHKRQMISQSKEKTKRKQHKESVKGEAEDDE